MSELDLLGARHAAAVRSAFADQDPPLLSFALSPQRRSRPGLLVALFSAFAVIALGLPLLLITRPPSTTNSTVGSAVPSTIPNATELWTQGEVGLGGDYLASGGEIVLADSDRLYVADGFGDGQSLNRVSVFDVRTGELIWEREDLQGLEYGVFLQTLADDILVINGQYRTITAVDTANGLTIWSFELPTGYGAKRSSIRDGVLYIATDTSAEGDTQPPIVYAFALEDGTLLWETPLAQGTDAQWHNPPIQEGVVYVSSTLSHPGSAPGNMVHALEVASGEILWATNIGGEQGFSFHSAFIIGEHLITYSPEGATVALRAADGSVAWEQPGTFPIGVDPNGAIYGGGDGVVVLDSDDGSTTTLLDDGEIGFDVTGGLVQDDQLVLTSDADVAGYDFTTDVIGWLVQTPTATASPAVTSEVVAVPTGTPRGVSVFSMP